MDWIVFSLVVMSSLLFAWSFQTLSVVVHLAFHEPCSSRSLGFCC